MSEISLVGLKKADVLAALYNASKPQGMGFMHYDSKPMAREEAEGLLKQTTRFDYLKGRVMKVNLAGDELDTRGYDCDNGQGAAERAIAELRATSDANSSTIQATHHTNTLEAAEDVKTHLNEGSSSEIRGGVVVFHLGLSDVAGKLGPAVDDAIGKHKA
ncbi:MAG: hypothetical protein A3D67_02240 [Candidatus Lloydbacteria bacterium RIFCSPHIGHO2_02_FULL_51_22]|uniref:Uncharacterized protein n=3 Tax=Candidatus Lloydiibacteriota TaxID=1817910 RepID=A0A1G2DD01_9BACT|nr:MAG: hypothetical protein A3D67_02240 [Candidatus Lloydbacteria bacterium RIFCSPHIGHO2_02_FULL_51_22]OGZ14046.1 MAG: hypothetical protein A3J08_03920 [Candidatus Lloydbacteria bacterium RIFCSPLOWO2_02_FULL_51_11]OGZ16885.1 MAG: hypothetical protein A3G11_01450 [Candidatus Lloydbacteria bacterium RIFCSPLOWO2_12_FULL_51_9]